MKTKKNDQGISKRGYLRYNPEKNTLGLISFKPEIIEFTPDYVSIVCNESFTGCCVVMLDNIGVRENKHLLIRCGQLGVMKGLVRWVKHLDENAIKVGIEYLDVE
jgi:hypothetical protein